MSERQNSKIYLTTYGQNTNAQGLREVWPNSTKNRAPNSEAYKVWQSCDAHYASGTDGYTVYPKDDTIPPFHVDSVAPDGYDPGDFYRIIEEVKRVLNKEDVLLIGR
jgi:hypothetical protein